MSLISQLQLGAQVVGKVVQPIIDVLHNYFTPGTWFLEAKIAAQYAASVLAKTQFATDMQSAVGQSINLITTAAAQGVLKDVAATTIGKEVVQQAVILFKNGAEPSTATTDPAANATTDPAAQNNLNNDINNQNNTNNLNNDTNNNR